MPTEKKIMNVLILNSRNGSRLVRVARIAVFSILSIYAFFGALSEAKALTLTNVFIDSSKPWIGYMNWYTNLTAYSNNLAAGGSVWGTADLRASFNSNGVASLTPNINVYNAADPYWVNPDGTGAKIMEANFYVQDDTLAGSIVKFAGNVWSDTLVAPYYTKVFIRDFVPDYSSFTATNRVLTSATTNFSMLYSTVAGHHIQYGFATVGPDANPANALSLGSVILSSNTPPTNVSIATPPQNTYALVNSNAAFQVTAIGGNLSYQWKNNGVNLTNSSSVSGATSATLTLSNVSKATQATYTVVVASLPSTNTAQASASLTVVDPTHLTVDPSAPWTGYMNWYTNNNGTIGAYRSGNSWAIADLRASINNYGTITFLPNINAYNPADPYWVNPNGTGAEFMDALFYQQWDGLGGLTVTFVGYCQTNSLVAPYTCKAYIREFLPDYSAYDEAQVSLVSGQSFTVSKSTAAGDHVQWGFETLGPDANPATASTLGQAKVSAVNPPLLAVAKVGGLVRLNFNTESGFNYTVQYKTNLAVAAWQTLSVTNGTGSSVTVTNSAGLSQSYYRLSIQ